MNSGKNRADGTGGRDGTDRGSVRGPRGPKNMITIEDSIGSEMKPRE